MTSPRPWRREAHTDGGFRLLDAEGKAIVWGDYDGVAAMSDEDSAAIIAAINSEKVIKL